VRFRRFSVAHALAQERGTLPPPLAAGEGDAALAASPDKLRAASRLLQGRPVRLLPGQE
jgi:hypothetical protein